MDLKYIEEESKGGDFVVNREIFDILFDKTTIGLPVCVLCIMGEYRGGKSFFLNFVVRYLNALEKGLVRPCDKDEIPGWMTAEGAFIDGYERSFENFQSGGKILSTEQVHDKPVGFSVRGGTERNTTGILFWKKPFIIPDPKKPSGKLCVLLMDTQGLWDPETHNKLNSCIFGLSCVLSSYLIFNHKGTLNSEHLSQMAMLSSFSQGLSSTEMGKAFQRIDLLCRDFANIDPTGESSDVALQEIREWKHEVEEKPAFKPSTDKLKECFERFDVMCLPIPGYIDDPAYNGDIREIYKLFMCMLGHYIESVFQQIEPRRIGGQIVTGKRFKEYAIRYGEIFKSQTTFPDSSMILDTTSEIANVEIMNECLRSYDNEMIKFQNSAKSVDEEKIAKFHHGYSQQLINYFLSRAKGSDALKEKNKTQMAMHMDKVYKNIIVINNRKREAEELKLKRVTDTCFKSYSTTVEVILSDNFCITDSELERAHEKAKDKAVSEFEKYYKDEVSAQNQFMKLISVKYDEYKRKRESMIKAYGLKTIVKSQEQFSGLDAQVTTVEIQANGCSSAAVFDITPLVSLKYLAIGEGNFTNVGVFSVHNMANLERLVIAAGCFRCGGSACNPDHSFSVVDCPVLQSIEIGANSFNDYCGGFTLSKLPQLTTLKIGRANMDSKNFIGCSLTLRDLSSLEDVEIGGNSFCFSQQTVFDNLPKLTKITLGGNAFKGLHDKPCTLTMSNLPSLQSFTSFGMGCFAETRIASFTNIPALKSLYLPDSFKSLSELSLQGKNSRVISMINDSKMMLFKVNDVMTQLKDMEWASEVCSKNIEECGKFLSQYDKVNIYACENDRIIASCFSIIERLVSALNHDMEEQTANRKGSLKKNKWKTVGTITLGAIALGTLVAAPLIGVAAAVGTAVSGTKTFAERKELKNVGAVRYSNDLERDKNFITRLENIRSEYSMASDDFEVRAQPLLLGLAGVSF